MLKTAHPLREKMTLFWHNHFATSNAKVQNAGYMLGQYELMQKHALGNFRELLVEMSTDPAMLVWLDTVSSTKGKPNENYARELMELFSLGIGNYTEKDIREAARAFTGCEIKDGKGVLNPRQHDAGEKTVLGNSGKFQGEDIAHICLEQDACPRFIVRKLYRFLSANRTTPPAELIDPLAEQFRKCGLRHRQARRDDAAVEPVLLAGRVPREDQVAGRVRARHRPRAGRHGRHAAAGAERSKGWGKCCSRRRRSRAGTAARPGSTGRRCSAARTSRWR